MPTTALDVLVQIVGSLCLPGGDEVVQALSIGKVDDDEWNIHYRRFIEALHAQREAKNEGVTLHVEASEETLLETAEKLVERSVATNTALLCGE